MTAISDLSSLINRMSGGNSGSPDNKFFSKVARIAGTAAPAPIAGRPTSLWMYDGYPAAGAAPTSTSIPDQTTNGGLKQADPSGGRQKWLVQLFASSLNAGTLVLYDRLLHVGGLSGTVTSPQAVQGSPASPALTRYTGAASVGNMMFAEIYSAVGSTGTTITAAYENQSGASKTSVATAFGGTNFREQTRMIPLPLAAGDTGVAAIDTVTLAASTLTAGNFGITLARPLAYCSIGGAGAAGWRDFATGLPGLPEIKEGACLSMFWIAGSAAAPELFGGISTVDA